MAERRMFSKRIISSAKFLRMPNEAQNLYFHLGLNADDDGVVEAFTVLRQTGINEDNLRVLAIKNFVKVLDDDELITFITDFRENNSLRADRKKDSIYKDLLLQVCPEVDLLESKNRKDRPKKKVGRPNDNQASDDGRLSIVEYSVVEDSIDYSNNTLRNHFDMLIRQYNLKGITAQQLILECKGKQEKIDRVESYIKYVQENDKGAGYIITAIRNDYEIKEKKETKKKTKYL